MVALRPHPDLYVGVADPRRRAILDLLLTGERGVNALVDAMDLRQPAVSKQLRILKESGLVSVRKAGRQRLYRVNAGELRKMYEWTKTYEQIWNERFDKLDAYLASPEGETK
ncbi:MAG: winged helix-turn-helix transcriptional regulator [Planctomycetes bacterium]|nr:winged helix-turn-helix transcriptional regulator [Planctomycetota bacterium]